MPEASDIHNGVPILVAIACLLVASRYASRLRQPWCPRRPGPEIDGTKLYYGGKRWPQYEARFNLRLSYVYGPVVVIRHQSTSLPARLKRWFDCWVWRTQACPDTTVLINSFSKNESVLKGLVGSCASRRPCIPAGKYLSRGRRIVLQPYGPDWRRHRGALELLLTRSKIENRWARALRHEAMVMVRRIAELGPAASGPAGMAVLKEVSRFTASSVLQITYARRAETPDDGVLEDLRVVSQNIASAFTPGKYRVEDLPLLDMLPAVVSPWKRKLNSDHRFEMTVFDGLLQGVEGRLDQRQGGDDGSRRRGRASQGRGAVIAPEECAAAELLRAQKHWQLDRGDVAYLAAGIFEAGTETTAMTINTFLLAAACYPQMTRRAQAEMDGYMCSKDGTGGAVPALADLQQLPYLGAVVREALRLTPTGSSGVGHVATQPGPQALELEGDGPGGRDRLTIPPGATVLANTYGLHHDRDRYADPWRFDPDRWMSGGCSLDHTHASWAFGFGRRMCPGAALASRSLSMALALLLLCFDFELTGQAGAHWRAAEERDGDELGRWAALFPGAGGAAQRERASKLGQAAGDGDRAGRGLIDAYIASGLSREQLAECVRLEPRRGRPWLAAVGGALDEAEAEADNTTV